MSRVPGYSGHADEPSGGSEQPRSSGYRRSRRLGTFSLWCALASLLFLPAILIGIGAALLGIGIGAATPAPAGIARLSLLPVLALALNAVLVPVLYVLVFAVVSAVWGP